MSKVKIIIELKNGYLGSVSSSQEIDIVIIDHDNIDKGEPPVKDILQQDAIFLPGEAYKLYTDASDPRDMEIREELKRIHF